MKLVGGEDVEEGKVGGLRKGEIESRDRAAREPNVTLNLKQVDAANNLECDIHSGLNFDACDIYYSTQIGRV